MRLTYNIGNEETYNLRSNCDVRSLSNKLGQLEDIEDELGIDLITLFKALKNGFYGTMYGLEKDIAREHGKPLFYELKYIDIKKYNNKFAFIYYLGDMSYSDFIVYLWKDYGITWALTKEELL